MVIVVGVDPGARDTGVAVIDWTFRTAGPPPLIASTTVSRTDDRALTDPPPTYLLGVRAAVRAAIADHGAHGLAVEGLTRPKGHARGRGGHLIDPSALIGCAQALGAVISYSWLVPCVTVPPMGNGQLFPLKSYPDPISTAGKGRDKRRHERSAYDVAVSASTELTRILNGGRR